MNSKLNALIAAALMAAAGSANAAIDNSLSGNGSLYLSVWNGVDTSASFDLGYNMDSFLPSSMSTPGININWNLVGSSVSNNAGLAPTTLTYASNWTSFAATVADWSKVVYDVAAMDSVGTAAGNDRFLSTSRDALSLVDDQSNSNLIGFNGVDSYVTNNNLNGTHATAANGAALQVAGSNAYYPTGKNAKWFNKATFTSNDNIGDNLGFFLLTTSSTNGINKATVTQYPGVFNLSQTGALSYVTPVPEASTYGMMLAGLGLVGFMARRRMGV